MSTKKIDKINNTLLSNSKQSKISKYSKTDSPEIIYEFGNFLSTKYGVTINYVNDEELRKLSFSDPEFTAAFCI